MMWTPDTCSCKVNLYNMTLVRPCSIHKNIKETMKHNRTLNHAYSKLSTLEQKRKEVKSAKKNYYEKQVDNPTWIERFRRLFRIGS